MGFPGTFARLQSRLRQIVENQVRYGPNGPGNQASGRSATMVTRTVSRGRYSIKFRSTCTLPDRSFGAATTHYVFIFSHGGSRFAGEFVHPNVIYSMGIDANMRRLSVGAALSEAGSQYSAQHWSRSLESPLRAAVCKPKTLFETSHVAVAFSSSK
jgi:hypothetical protein